MKKIFVTVLFYNIYLLCYSQNSITTNNPCTDVMAQNAKGKWIHSSDNGSHNTKETSSRLDQIHDLVMNIYPQPTGLDASWHRTAGISYFGAKRKYYKTTDGRLTFDYSNLAHFTYYYYAAGFFSYRCENDKTHSLVPGYPGETGTWFDVIANNKLNDTPPDDDWTINGFPVLTKKPAKSISDGIEILQTGTGSNTREVYVYRKGAVPYIPVTRKQYLERCMIYHTNLHDQVIKGIEQMPVRPLDVQEKEKKAKLDKLQKDYANDPKKLKANVDYYLASYQTDQQRRDDQIIKAKKNKEDELQKFRNELEKTTNEGLLSTPAIVRVQYYSTPVFETDASMGLMLITENPDYIRKELPQYVPQFFIVYWSWDNGLPQQKLAEIIEQKFPFDRLQAMIDK